jgi:cell wall-associated NlpC family hydrolase
MASGPSRNFRNWAALSCLAFSLFLGMLPTARADTQRHRKRPGFTPPLQPFLLVRSAVHGIVAPVAHNAPRVLVAAAVEPIRVAYRATHFESEKVMRAEPVEPLEPIQMAYYASRRQRTRPPRADPVQQWDSDDQEHEQRKANFRESSDDAGGSGPSVSGSRAVLRNGVAYAPSLAPANVKAAIWAANTLRHKPYVWGGGHGSFDDRGYDCSGTVSFALHGGGLLAAPLPSTDFRRYGERGRGRWITIYSRSGHTFAMIAGLRLDTTDFRSGGNDAPRWHADGRDTRGFEARHPIGM